MKIVETELPKKSVLQNTNFDYSDSFSGQYEDANQDIITVEDITKAFFQSAPQWSEYLFEFRNKIVKLFGLKTSGEIKDKESLLDDFKCEPNEKVGLFTIFQKNEDEVILGEDDKHLDFRVSLYKEPFPDMVNTMKLTISTTVHFHNRFGRWYFLPVKPFHKMIVPKMLEKTLEQIRKT